MPVTDDQVAALRALLTDDMARYKLLFNGLDRAAARKGYTALVTAAFAEAVERRFGQDRRQGDIVEFIADVRARSDRLAEELDPDISERVIHTALGEATARDLSDSVVTGTQVVLLAGLISDEQPDGDMLDAHLASARKLADQLIR